MTEDRERFIHEGQPVNDSDELDGIWMLSWRVTPEPSGFMGLTNATLILRRGRFVGLDEGGFRYFGRYTWPAPERVDVEAFIDPSQTPDDHRLLTGDGNVTRNALRYEVSCELVDVGGERRALGSVVMGDYTYNLKLTRKGGLP